MCHLVNTITEQNLVPYHQGRKAASMIDPDGRIDIKAVEGGKLYQGSTLDYYEQGMLGAKFIVEKLGEKGGKVAIIEGLLGSPQGEARRDGAKDTFEAAANVEIVSIQAGDWDRRKALDATTNILQANPDLAGIYCANDVMALAAYEAVAAAGKEARSLLVLTSLKKPKKPLRWTLAASVVSPYMEGMISLTLPLWLSMTWISAPHILSVFLFQLKT